MKNMFKVFGIITLVAVIGFTMTACDDDGSDGNKKNGGGKIDYTANSVDELATWLEKQPGNAISSPYTVKLKVNDLTAFETIRTTLNKAGRYVYLDFSDSPLTTIPGNAFYGYNVPGSSNGCRPLTGITIPDSVTSIGYQAFYGCTSLTSVTFQGTISGELNYSFYGLGDLYNKYTSGGIGTYKTTAPVGANSVWTKQ